MDRDDVSRLIGARYLGLVALLNRKLQQVYPHERVEQRTAPISSEHVVHGHVEPSIAGRGLQAVMRELRNMRESASSRDTQPNTRSAQSSLAAPAETQVQIARIVQELPTAREREIVKRYYLDEQDKDTICRALGLYPLQFDKLITRVRKHMRVLIHSHLAQK